ncbi:hypothetical protein BBF96_14795 [Anoxybacter fermentans]|uniref:Radical SAM core domain-containing protein n=1 Tax=Anoxybacter fermentans TaxID=1323375 RepID=A0A3S9T245_9FIRM|nr:radical SAM protein [Anoxybacter fermentans]AZR74542.1 hypothetical protein BBF96_14795 [Anoxybacter fermentans]
MLYYRAPLAIDFDLTLKCNLNCLHCNVTGGKSLDNEMTTEQVMDVLDQLYNAGVYNIALTGGELLCRKDWRDLVLHAATDKEWKIVINTNGILWNPEDIDFIELLKEKVNISISLDGYDPKSYGILRKKRDGQPAYNEFNRIIKNVEHMLSKSINVHINYTLTKLTLSNFFKTLDFLIKDLGVNGVLGIKFFPYGRGKINYDNLELSYGEWKNFLKEATILKKDKKYKKFIISVTCPWEMYLPLLELGYSLNEIEYIWNYISPLRNKNYSKYRDLGCNAGITSCAISPDGMLTPCGSVSARIPELFCGNILESSLEQVWRESKVLKKLRNLKLKDINNGECVKCDLKKICGGGCRARAFVINGSLDAKDPACPKKL